MAEHSAPELLTPDKVDIDALLQNFEPTRVGEVEVDDRRRITLGAFAGNNRRFAVWELEDGRLIMIPVVSVVAPEVQQRLARVAANAPAE